MQTFFLELELKSPVHVGVGSDHNWPAYAYLPDRERGEVVLLDPARLVAALEEGRREAFLSAVAEGPARAQRLLRGWYREGLPLPELGRLPASPAFLRAVEEASDQAELEFRPLPRSLEGPYLPGSSVKGALRTAWIYAKLEPRLRENDLVYNRREGWRLLPKRREVGVIRPGAGGVHIAQELEAFALGYLGRRRPDMRRDPWRAVRLGDGPGLSGTRLECVGVVHPKDRLRDVSILAEVIPEGTQIRLSFRYHRALYEEGIVAGAVDPEKLADSAYSFYFGVLEEDFAYADQNGWERAAKFYREFLKEIQDRDDAFPLRIGFGSGKLANTLLFLLDESFPQTRKAVGSVEPRHGVPLGWVMARLLGTGG